MLIKCPECELQVSDKAYSCPHCGYPMKKPEISTKDLKPAEPSARTNKHRRLPNGFGQITELKNRNLRNRFRVMITVSKTEEGTPICKLLKPKSYFATYNEAYAALVEYNKNPYDLDSIITMKELYEKWSKEFYKTVSKGTERVYKAAWSYCAMLHDCKVTDVKTGHIRRCIEEAEVPLRDGSKVPASANTKNRMKIILNALFDYAVEYDLVDKNYSRAFKLSDDVIKEIETTKAEHIALDEEEMKKLWDNEDTSPYIGYILFQCYSGWRPTEFCQIMLSDVNVKEGYIKGGAKTEAGKDRIVPIHSKVRHIVDREYKRAKELNSAYLFNFLNSHNNSGTFKLSYDRYRRIFNGVVSTLHLNPEHRPHDTRKTFATRAKKYKVDEYALKRMIGHDIDDLTEAVYTERSLDWYKEEIEKIK